MSDHAQHFDPDCDVCVGVRRAAPSDPAAPLRDALEVISEGRHPDGHRGAVLVARAALATPAPEEAET